MGKLEALYGELILDHKPLQLGLIDKKYAGLGRALELIDFEKAAVPHVNLHSLKRWRFRMCDAAFLLNQETNGQEVKLDNLGNVVVIHYCKRKTEKKFQWIWELCSLPVIDVEDEETDPYVNAYKLASNHEDAELRTSSETKCLSDVVEAYYSLLTRYKYAKAIYPMKKKQILFKGEVYTIKEVDDSRGRNPYDIVIKTYKLPEIKDNLDWRVYRPDQYIEGELRCDRCKLISNKESMAALYVSGHGVLCGPCRDNYYEAGTITSDMWDEPI